MDIILQGVTGSKAYGIDTPESDTDLLGVYVVPTVDLLGLRGITSTYTHTDPDITTHEVGKFVALATKCNPTILELLFLDNYLVQTPEGRQLVAARSSFLSDIVVKSYGGYALAQLRKLEARGDFSSDLKKRTAKHGRHCFRLLQQGEQLRRTGRMSVRVDNRDEVFAAGEFAAANVVQYGRMMRDRLSKFDAVPSVLPAKPDMDVANDLLIGFRLNHLSADAYSRAA